ncbi:MAG: 8-amino-7-oxononanoate synthase [Bacteroidetes bacterium ADurb.Bin408]|nr:MAG: 8-amino-7-oxononanoate synthase [Bacteroidetes bacterium ADurb.Bin408]
MIKNINFEFYYIFSNFEIESLMVKRYEAQLNKRKTEGSYINLTTAHNTIDFCSNDFLGLSASTDLKTRILKFLKNLESVSYVGGTGSRIISGNTALIESLENFIATYHYAEAGLLFNSGYDANIGLLSCLPERMDTVFYDRGINPSVKDGIRLSHARALPFKHNNLTHLEQLLNKSKGQPFVVVQSVYASDGAIAPLKEIYRLCASHNALLIVDESYAAGIYGNGGKGLVVENELSNKVFARVISFSKAFGCHGAIVLGSQVLRNYLINFSRPFIYSTAVPFYNYISVKSAYDLLNENEELLLALQGNIACFKKLIEKSALINSSDYIESQSPVQCFYAKGNSYCKKVTQALNRAGFDIKPLLSPFVAKGAERIRVCIHAFNTHDEMAALVRELENQLLKNQ